MHLGEDVCICGLVCREDATSKFINLCIFLYFLYFCICQLNPSQVKVCISEKMCVFAAWMVEKMPQANWCFPRTYPQRPSLLLSNAQAQITLPKIQLHLHKYTNAQIHRHTNTQINTNTNRKPHANWCFPRTYPQRPSLLLSNAQAQITLPKIQLHLHKYTNAQIHRHTNTQINTNTNRKPHANWCFPRTYPQRPSLLPSNAQAQITLLKIQLHLHKYTNAQIQKLTNTQIQKKHKQINALLGPTLKGPPTSH